MNRLNPQALGLSVGVFFAFVHLCWAVLVWLDVAQYLLDLIFKLHMIAPPFKVVDFDIGKSIALVCVTGFIGYILGVILGFIWNRCKT